MNEMNPKWVDAVAAAIRKADGDHTMGAGALAEVVVATLVPLVEDEFKAELLDAHVAIDDALAAVREARAQIDKPKITITYEDD